MGFRFWRRIRIAPGLTVNLSKSGASVSVGRRGARYTIGPRGHRATVGIPGTGLFYTASSPTSGSRRGRNAGGAASVPEVPPEDRLTLGFFKRLVTPKDEEGFVDGCRELVLGSEAKAFRHLEQAVDLADGAYLAGFLALKRDELAKSARYLETAAQKHARLGRHFAKYGVGATLSLPITNEVAAHVGSDLRGVLLGLVEVYQRQERWDDAVACLERLRKLEPEDVLVKLSFCELVLHQRPGASDVCQQVVRMCEGIANETPIHGALLFYKAKALRGLGLLEAARDTLTQVLRRKKDRPPELLQALRYERALVYEELGQRRRARTELEKLYAEAPGYEDVAARLGLK